MLIVDPLADILCMGFLAAHVLSCSNWKTKRSQVFLKMGGDLSILYRFFIHVFRILFCVPQHAWLSARFPFYCPRGSTPVLRSPAERSCIVSTSSSRRSAARGRPTPRWNPRTRAIRMSNPSSNLMETSNMERTRQMAKSWHHDCFRDSWSNLSGQQALIVLRSQTKEMLQVRHRVATRFVTKGSQQHLRLQIPLLPFWCLKTPSSRPPNRCPPKHAKASQRHILLRHHPQDTIPKTSNTSPKTSATTLFPKTLPKASQQGIIPTHLPKTFPKSLLKDMAQGRKDVPTNTPETSSKQTAPKKRPPYRHLPTTLPKSARKTSPRTTAKTQETPKGNTPNNCERVTSHDTFQKHPRRHPRLKRHLCKTHLPKDML